MNNHMKTTTIEGNIVITSEDTDTPLARLKLCFPHLKVSKSIIGCLTKYYRDFGGVYLEDINTLSISDIKTLIVNKGKLSGLEIDIIIIDAIERDFREEVKMETNLSWEIINSSSIQELLSPELMKNKLTFIKTDLGRISDYALYKSNAYDTSIKIKDLKHY